MSSKAKTKKPVSRSASSEATRERIMRAATDLFLEQGFGNTNLEAVAEASGVTKPTVYAHFGSKEGLLLAITEAHTGENARRLSMSLATTGDIRADLTNFGMEFLQRTQNPTAACWHRLAVAEVTDHPEIGKAIFSSGPGKVLRALTKFMAGEITAGRLDCDNPDIAAEQFLGLLLGINPIRVMTGQPMPGPAKRTRICHQAVDTFMAAYAVNVR